MTGRGRATYGGSVSSARDPACQAYAGGIRSGLWGQRGWVIGMVFAAVWLAFLVAPLTDAWTRHPAPGPRALSTALMVCFVAVYLLAVGAPFRFRRGRWHALVPVVLVLLALAYLPLAGQSGLNLLIFASVAAHATLSMWRAVATTLAIVVLSIVLLAALHWDDDAGYPLAILAASMAMFGVVRMAERNRALEASQQERSRTAVLEERERIGRDLHDILGHSLTVIAVKSELAGKLLATDPARARTEIADIERLTRDALADVRATAAGVREVTLVGELSSARAALLTAGIEPELPSAVEDVPGELREVFGYVVREGVTNVIRHSGAARCWVRVSADAIEVRDDGAGQRAAVAGGHGLAGLRARVEAAGLVLVSGRDGGGFRLAAQRPARRAVSAPAARRGRPAAVPGPAGRA